MLSFARFPFRSFSLARGSIALVEQEADAAAGQEGRPASEPGQPERPGRRGRDRRGAVLSWLARAWPFLLFLPLFCLLAWEKAKRDNTGMGEKGYDVIFDHDQHAYLNMARKIRESGYTRVDPRHRMPGYPVMMSLLHREADAYPLDPTREDPRGVSDAYFARAKMANIGLCALSLIALYLTCRPFLPRLESHLVTWGYGWLLAVFRAPYVQPEGVFYVLFFISLAVLWRLLTRPAWWLAPLAALTLAAAFILKSSVMPLIALFLFCAGVKLGASLFLPGALPGASRRDAWRGFALAAIVPALFAAILLPYFINTARMYGSPLWDVHSRHYMWMNDDAEKRFWRSAGIASPGFVPPEGKEPPTARTYLATHGVGDIAARLGKGWSSTYHVMRKQYRGTYRLIWYLGVPLLVLLALGSRRRTREAFRKHWLEWMLALGFLGGYATLYCWYQVIGVGPRLFLALFLPAWFFLALAIHRLSDRQILRVGKWQAPARNVACALFLAYLAYSGIEVMTRELWKVDGGR